MNGRTYSRKEIAALMERAAELQSHGPTGDEDGLTLDELEAVAASSGIDPAALRQAAREMGGVSREATDEQSDTQIFAERFVSFPDLNDESLAAVTEEVIIELRHRFGNATDPVSRMLGYGIQDAEQIGKTMEWRHTSDMGIVTTVQMRPRGDGVQLRMSQNVGWASPMASSFAYALIPAVLAAVVAMIMVKTGFVVLGVFAVAMLVFSPLIRSIDVNWRAKKDRELEALADRLARTIATTVPKSEPGPQRPLLDDLDPESTASGDRQPSYRTRI